MSFSGSEALYASTDGASELGDTMREDVKLRRIDCG